jgi:hypothetical protein
VNEEPIGKSILPLQRLARCSLASDGRDNFSSYGLEVEIEDTGRLVSISDKIKSNWEVTRDDSLRSGVEFINKQPPAGLTLDEAMHSLLDLRKFYSSPDKEANWRAAFQMHIGTAHRGLGYLESLMLTYTALEPALFGQAGFGRHQSNFCVPWSHQPDVILSLFASVRGGDHSTVVNWLNRFNKYSALNLLTLTTIGTVEFRMAQTPTGPGAFSEMVALMEAWDSVMFVADLAHRTWVADEIRYEVYEDEDGYDQERRVPRPPEEKFAPWAYNWIMEHTSEFREKYEGGEAEALCERRDALVARMINLG